MIVLLYLFICGGLFYLFNELEDESVRNRWSHHQQFFNSIKSWKNKWNIGAGETLLPAKYKWYYFGIIPAHEERFPYSSTILVWVTDGEHLFQFLKKRAIDVGFLVLDWKYFVAWELGTLIVGIIKEKFLKKIQ